MIEELTVIALEAIEQAASEAAKAAILSMLEREVATLREAERWRREAEALRQAKRKTALITGIISFISGLAAGTIITIGVTR